MDNQYKVDVLSNHQMENNICYARGHYIMIHCNAVNLHATKESTLKNDTGTYGFMRGPLPTS